MNIEELKRLAEAATPGPWEAWQVGDYPPLFTVSTEDRLGLFTTTTEAENETEFAAVFQDEDAAYIAAANPAAVLELIQQRDELLAALKDAREMVSDWAGYASPYFQEKHDIDGDLKKLDEAIAKAEG